MGLCNLLREKERERNAKKRKKLILVKKIYVTYCETNVEVRYYRFKLICTMTPLGLKGSNLIG